MSHAFTVVLRGYDRTQVDRLVSQADQALASGSETARLAALQTLNGAKPGVSLRGYDRAEVDRALNQRRDRLAAGSQLQSGAGSSDRPGPGDRSSADNSDHFSGDDPGRSGSGPDRPGTAQPDQRGGAQFGDRPLSPAARPAPPEFTVVLRGYAVPEVDKLFTQVDDALASGSEISRAAARQALVTADFPVSLRGYDRRQVDQLIEFRLRLLTEAG
ncbi:hypothetical protein [Actinoplanes sp. NBRC 103695]|uniref:hypothetical protein n=1 Tax=Actinoplanes sp. NBRC 103695 TaxID=3032202 RepID=UPI0024A5D771|nr:hypothetical protein [Actinoplanes sp. NBRC 103695]GLZ00374.1 hypothetical protein Acsp02_76260 [Actinoplanes sp. NBRC 103695]